MPPRIEKPEPITFNLMRGVSTKEKSVTAKLKSGVIEYPGMSPSELIIYFGQAGYSFYNLQTKKLELFYDITRHSLIRLSDLGGTAHGDAIADLTNNFTIAAKKAEDNMGINENANTLGKWAFGIIFILAVMGMVFIYLMTTHAGASLSAGQATTTITQTPFLHINAT